MSVRDLKSDNLGQEELEKFAVDGLIPSRVLFPESNEEAAQILKEANENAQKVAIRGGGTKTGLGNPIQALDTVVSTTRLNKILEYEPGDLTVCVQAGANLAWVQTELEKYNQFLPVESPLSNRATVGGVIATASSGPTRLMYGPARDWLIGVRYALADGTLARGGGRVVKNVAGFDMMKLFTGSLGTLGMMLELNFKLLPLPKASATLVMNFNTTQEASEAALRIIDGGLFPTSETVLDEKVAGALGYSPRVTLLVEVRNTALAVERQIKDINQLAWQLNGSNFQAVREPDSQRKLWEGIRDFPYQESAGSVPDFVLKAGVAPTQCSMVLRHAHLIAAQHHLEVEGLAHAGHGLIYLTGNYAFEEEAATLAFINEISQKVESGGGSVTAERVPLSLKRRLNDIWGNTLSRGELNLMRGIKQKLDPTGTLNPGRFVAGI
jgi:glycolate oxidase FAD binding subunit